MHLVPEHEDTPAMTAAPQGRSGRREACASRVWWQLSALALAGCQGQVSNGFMPQSISDSGTGSRTSGSAAGSRCSPSVSSRGASCSTPRFGSAAEGGRGTARPAALQLPVELLYTIIPVFMVAVFFYYTARDEAALTDVSQAPDVTISVVGQAVGWDFNYVDSMSTTPGSRPT